MTDDTAERQRQAAAAGRAAERAGRRVIYIHGRPYADPGDELAADAPGDELPADVFPWREWYGEGQP